MGGWNTDGDKLNKYASATSPMALALSNKEELCGWGDWAVWGGVCVPINDKLKAQRAGRLHRLEDLCRGCQPASSSRSSGFTVEPEVEYTNWDSTNNDSWAGILRFQRSF